MVRISHLFQSFSGLEDVAHVLEMKGEVYNAVLGMVDITRGTNSYYKLQVLKKDKSERSVYYRIVLFVISIEILVNYCIQLIISYFICPSIVLTKFVYSLHLGLR